MTGVEARLRRIEAAIPPPGRRPVLIVHDPLAGVTIEGCPDLFASVDEAFAWLRAMQDEPASPDLVVHIR